MLNFGNFTASEIIAQMPQARNLLAQHFGPEGISTSSGALLRDLARDKGVELRVVVQDLNAMARSTGMFG